MKFCEFMVCLIERLNLVYFTIEDKIITFFKLQAFHASLFLCDIVDVDVDVFSIF